MTRAAIVLALALGVCTTGAFAQLHEVPAELWDRPRTGADIVAQESVKRAVNAAIAQPDSRLVIHHGVGQESLLHAEELRSWLIALALDGRRIVLRSDQPAGATLKIEVIQ